MKNKKLHLLTIILSIFILGITFFFASYYFFMNKSIKQYTYDLNIQIDHINKINASVKNLVSFNDFDTNKTLNTMQHNISLLQNSLYNIRSLNSTKKYLNHHKNLLNGIETNILIYKQVVLITKNLDNNNLSVFLKNLEKYKTNTLTYYSSIYIPKIKITLPNDTLNFLDNFIKYSRQHQLDRIDKEIHEKQTLSIINSLNDFIIDFNNLKKDYINDLKIGLCAAGYTSLLNELAEDKSSLSALNSNLSTLNIPQIATPVYEAFTTTIESYSSYIDNLKYNLNIEQLTSSSDIIKKESINKLFKSSRQDFQDIQKYYETFLDLFNNYKNS